MATDAVSSILSKKEDFIRRHLVLSSSVIDTLATMEVIGHYTYGQMKAHAVNSEKQMALLMICLKAKGLENFQRFLDALRATLHGWIADDILESKIEVADTSSASAGKLVIVRDVMNKAREDRLVDKSENQLEHSTTNGPAAAANMAPPTSTLFIPNRHGNMGQYPPHGFVIPATVTAPHMTSFLPIHDHMQRRRRQESRDYVSSATEREDRARSNYDRVSPINQVPENLRDLQRMFNNETASARKSLSILRQEEVTIKALLQQNLREQQDILIKQESLTEISDNLKQINNTAAQIFRPDPDAKLTRKRLSLLQRVPWNTNN